MDRPLQQVRFVSARYWELQGLRSVLVGGASVVVFGLTFALGGPAPPEHVEALAFGAFFVLFVSGMLWLDRYYARVFGRILPSVSRRRWITFAPAGLFLVIFSAERALGVPRLGLAFASGAGYLLWIVWRDRPRRQYYMLGAAAAALAAALQWMGPAGGNTAVMAGFVIIGAAMVVTGLRDHQLLASTLQPDHREGDPAQALSHEL